MMKFFGRVGTVMEFLIPGPAADSIDFLGRKIFLNQTVPGHLLYRFIPSCAEVSSFPAISIMDFDRTAFRSWIPIR